MINESKLMDFSTLVEKVNDWQATLSDDVVNSEKMAYRQPTHLTYTTEGESQLFGEAGLAVDARLNDRAFGQLCGRLGVPSQWASDDGKCPEALRDLVFNWKFANIDPTDLMVRLRENKNGLFARAILSDQYTPYDNAELVNAVKTAVETMGMKTKVMLNDFGDNLKAYLVFPKIDFAANGDHIRPVDGRRTNGNGNGNGSGGIHPAVYLGNSEVGGGRVRITGGGYQGYCTNGIIYGWSADETFSVVHRWKTKKHMNLYVNEALATALKMSEQGAIKFLEAQATEIKKTHLADIMDNWAGKYGLLVSSKEAWAEMVNVDSQRKPVMTWFDVIDDLTFTAKGITSPDQRETMERMAGDMVFAEVPIRHREGVTA